MNDRRTCRHPDRDVPKLLCGYPLPCPHDTVVVDLAARTVTIPFDSDALKEPYTARIGGVARALEARKR